MNQTSSFGGLLDMVTDRCSTLGLLYVLGGEYTKVDEDIGFPFFRCVRVALTPVLRLKRRILTYSSRIVVTSTDVSIIDTH